MSPSLLLADKTAQKAHQGQLRDGGDPYITHPRRVQMKLKEYGLPEYVQIAGLLHDVLEDTSLTQENIKAIFGLMVNRLVLGMTKCPGVSYHSQLRDCAEKDPYIIMVKMADRIDNITTMSCWAPNRIERYLEDTEELINQVIVPVIQHIEDEILLVKSAIMLKELLRQVKFYK